MTRRILVAAAAAATLAVAGCSSDISGVAEPAGAATVGAGQTQTQTQAAPGRVDAPLASMLPAPEDFPAQYQALVLPEQAVEQAATDLDGIPPGAKVDPAGCKPPAQNFGPDGTALIVGTDNAARSTISVELTRVDGSLASRADEIGRCLELTTTKNGATAMVATTILPAPPVNADDTLALRQTVTSGTADRTVTQSMLRLLAQVDDVRISATYMSFGDGSPDSATLDQLFTEAVLEVTAAAK